MKNITRKSVQRSSPKQTRKINILYIVAFQLLGFTTVLLLEYQPLQSSSPEINLVFENAPTASNDLISYQICDQKTCKSFKP